ncbi:hypothetical protein HO173_012111 [Letharia columbiana]|uniref:Uncharacterized protein n=1 Tax=Letharia columbiana TaxID=112416 RepID=A0A8H6CR16_9LECA|nr:uncharacterized protein HO173_012111 [Letharia columbiana]KAF6227671.1 hypothetical protein HO173_012111 [Letharia columbiana]
MLSRPVSLRMTSRSIFSQQVRSYQDLFSRSKIPRQTLLPSSSFRFQICGIPRALEFHRCYTYSAATFNAATSRFPAHWELYRRSQPSNELIRYMRRWEDELRFDAKDALPRLTPQQRDVMMAACIGFRLKYNPNKEWRADRLKQALTAWRQGLQADKQSRQPRWNAAHIRKTEEHIAKTEKAIAADAAARKKKSDDEMKAFFGGFWGNAFALATLAFFSIGPLANFVLSWILTPGVKKREGAILARKVRCAGIAVAVSPLSAVYSDGLYVTPAARLDLQGGTS